jgi:hypothetical protein
MSRLHLAVMNSLVWLAIPAVALVVALLWVAWASRTPPRADTHETVEAHQRFRAAFEQREQRERRHPHGVQDDYREHRDSA